MSGEWQPIETAPKDGTPIRLKCELRPDFGEHLLYWDGRNKRWAGYDFTAMGSRDTWWDESQPQPTHWRLNTGFESVQPMLPP